MEDKTGYNDVVALMWHPDKIATPEDINKLLKQIRKEAIDEVLKLKRYTGGVVRHMVESENGEFIKRSEVEKLKECQVYQRQMIETRYQAKMDKQTGKKNRIWRKMD